LSAQGLGGHGSYKPLKIIEELAANDTHRLKTHLWVCSSHTEVSIEITALAIRWPVVCIRCAVTEPPEPYWLQKGGISGRKGRERELHH